nr:phospholipase A-2-activating protein [Cryptococcus depauperatus CBS 7855]
MYKPYKLAFTLNGHASDVRNLNVPSSQVPILLSASRDGSAIVWGPSSKSREWDVKMRVEGPEKLFVSCVGMTRWNGQAYLLVGSQSGTLSSYALPSLETASPTGNETLPEPVHTLFEHAQNLCCMDVSQSGLVASGSWDKAVIIWKDFKNIIKIEGHEQAVWAVKFCSHCLEGSADNKIILHSFDISSGKTTPLQTYTGHTQPVRGLALMSNGTGFWSCANDSYVNIYSFDHPNPLRSLSGHTSFIYSIATFSDGSGAITTGEDGTMRVWSETALLQTIPHTSNSLWSCAIPPSSIPSSPYIASSSSDSTIRFFTTEESLMASPEELTAWDEEIKNRQLDKSQIGDVKHSDLPGTEALNREGKKDGQVLMIKNNGIVEAYQWSALDSAWQQIGQVVDAIGQGRKQLFNGKEYDYVFDVDVSEGMPPLKLPYNVTENSWIAAQRFLENNNLPSSYTEQVVDFIHQNSGGAELGTGSGETGYADPFTGSSRYTGGGVSMASRSSGSDPFTGGSRYDGRNDIQKEASGGLNPLTGNGARNPTPLPTPVTQKNHILPVSTYLPFKQINVNAVKAKIEQFNNEFKTSSPTMVLSIEEENTLKDIYAFLNLSVATLPDSEAVTGEENFDPAKILALVAKWPEDKRFPFIDIVRVLAATSPKFGSHSPHSLLAASSLSEPWTPSKSRETNTLLALRALANLFNLKKGREVVTQENTSQKVLQTVINLPLVQLNKNARIAASTIALHYSISAMSSIPLSLIPLIFDLILTLLKQEEEDTEVIYRAGIALGNLLGSSSTRNGLQVGKVGEGKDILKSWAKKEGRLEELAREVETKTSIIS